MPKDQELWAVSIDLWKSGSVVTEFLRNEISGLRNAAGEPLSDAARTFLDDLVFRRIKPRKGRAVSKNAIREAYSIRRLLESVTDSTDGSPSERAVRSIAADLALSESTISQIVHPRKSRS